MILHSEYFPSTSWMRDFLCAGEIALEQWENYQKQGLRNRCKILGAQGIITLSVPLNGGREQKTRMRDVTINQSTRWNLIHLRAIKSCYSKAPFFDFYFDGIETVLQKQHRFLLDLNIVILEKVAVWLKWNGRLKMTSGFQENGNDPGIAQGNSLSTYEEKMPKPIVPVSSYVQVFSDRQPFVAGLSVLDLLFCVGPRAEDLLLSTGN